MMQYLIDTANMEEIKEALELGVKGVTANPSMYLKEKVNFTSFLSEVSELGPSILTAEVMEDTLENMVKTSEEILAINRDIIIKINFSETGLKLINILNKRGVKTAATLIFTLRQATIALNAGASYIFPFIGRNDEIGLDGLNILSGICHVIKINNYDAKVVAASIKNLNHLEKAALAGANYAAVTFDCFRKAMHHELTESGAKTFEEHWALLNK